MRPRCSAKSYNFFCIAFLPRCSRDITVPIGTSTISAISLYEKSFDIGEQHGDSERFRQLFERSLYLVVGEQFEQRVFCTAAHRPEVANPAIQVQILDVVEVGFLRSTLLGRGMC